MDKMKCNVCDNYLRGLEVCKFCSFEWATETPWVNDIDWDILDIDDEVEWSHLQIQYRLKAKGIDCLMVVQWWTDNIVVIVGAKASSEKVARALGVDERVISNDYEVGIMILNLYQEKCIRLGLDDEIKEKWDEWNE